MKEFKGKAIYNPSGKAGEYSYWACNFYVGCSVGCKYCFNKKGRGASILGGDKPELKKCFKDEEHALEIFRIEVLNNVHELIKHGLFFSFTTDPMLPETKELTLRAMNTLVTNGIPIKILTKCAEWVDNFLSVNSPFVCHGKATMHKIAFGFTLTGHDELEKGASTNQERIEATKRLHNAGFKTFVSIEPIIDFKSSWHMICDTTFHCDLYKIGLESGKKYDKEELKQFVSFVINRLENHSLAKIYFKDTLLSQAGVNRKDLSSVCVGRDYNLFRKEATNETKK